MTDPTLQAGYTATIGERAVEVRWPDNKHGGATPPPEGWQERAWEQDTLHEIDEGSVTGCSVLRWRDDPRSDNALLALSLALVTGRPLPAAEPDNRDLAAVSVPAPAPTDQAALRNRLDTAIDDVFTRWQTGLGDQRPQDAIRDAILAALPAPADRAEIRAAALREAADYVGNDDDCTCGGCDTCLPRKMAAELRRRADEATAEHHTVDGVCHLCHTDDHYCPPASGSGPAPGCLFCHPSSDTNQILATTPTCYARLDNFPAAPGHAEVIPYRHVESFLDLTPAEVADAHTLLRKLADQGGADGWTIGVNEGRAAGRTIDHVHIHLIPRHHGDVADPRGGVRNVLPGGNPDDWAAASGSGRVADETQARCDCPHPADEHSVYGCADGCACEWMPKRRLAKAQQPECACDPAPHREEDGTYSHWAGCPIADADQVVPGEGR